MSDSNLHRRDEGAKPTFVDGVAQIVLDPKGTDVQELDSDFTQPIPVTVTASYELNGQAIDASDLKGKSGTVKVTYTLANTTTTPMQVCIDGPDGNAQTQTVDVPEPLIASLSFTVPSDAKTFSAPGASLETERKGVEAVWREALFEPLGAPTQTFTYTYTTDKASVSEATLYLDNLQLDAGGVAAAKSASGALADAQAAALSALSTVQAGLSSLQEQLSQGGPLSGDGSAPSPPAPTSGRGTDTTTTSAERPAILPSLDLSAVNADLASISQTIDDLTTQAPGLANAASDLVALSDTLQSLVANVTTKIDDVVARLPEPVQKALELFRFIDQLKADLAAFSPEQQQTPEYQKLANDLDTAQAMAKSVSDGINDVDQRVQAVATEAHDLRTRIAELGQKAHALEAAAIVHATTVLDTKFADASADLQSKLATARGDASDAVQSARDAALTSLESARTNAEVAQQKAQADLDAAETDYARLLGIEALSAQHLLPGGNSTGATIQSGHYHLTIAGT